MHKQSQNHTNISDLHPLLRNDNDNVFATNKFVDVDTVFDQLNNLNLHNSDPYQNHNVTYNFDFDNGNDYNNNDDSDDINSTVEKLYLTHFLLAITLALIILSTVIGNLLVIAAILSERHLRSMGNYLVFSLAFADLMVAMLVMPLSAIYVVTGEWTLGASFCDLWTVADVLCCTASILHLLAIALDRYWAVTNVDYIHQRRNGKRISVMIFLIWLISLVISLAPILGWRDQDFYQRIEHKQCLLSQDVAYQIFATFASFYLPLLLILLLYWRIFQVLIIS
ncbi:5-hydroxytryptamine receptor 2B-like protein [Sarcoptes scabiei]|uniref:5-hydroxytryptamine receptor 2B-like protein n=1 Tax=Sarcoptes scabiei TaxID=52283 RepID=A0A132A042_SARSC|nr:5-hydroxytryptamine receptor 2B-like protein [Sarcoptes scabiei]